MQTESDILYITTRYVYCYIVMHVTRFGKTDTIEQSLEYHRHLSLKSLSNRNNFNILSNMYI